MAMVYLNRAVTLNPNFTIDSRNIHKLLLSSVVLATKYLDDDYCLNSHFAEIGGVKLLELNKLELSFLQLIQWKLHVQPDDYSFCHNRLLSEFDSQGPKATGKTHPINLLTTQSHINLTNTRPEA